MRKSHQPITKAQRKASRFYNWIVKPRHNALSRQPSRRTRVREAQRERMRQKTG